MDEFRVSKQSLEARVSTGGRKEPGEVPLTTTSSNLRVNQSQRACFESLLVKREPGACSTPTNPGITDLPPRLRERVGFGGGEANVKDDFAEKAPPAKCSRRAPVESGLPE